MPSWWPGVIRYLSLYASDDAVGLVPIENSPSPVMEYTMALDLAERALVSAPADITVGELLAWVRPAWA